jgi:CRISPR-associated protein Csb2
MGHCFCISVTFLDPLFHGQGDTGPEWPPSPMRLYQALLAGARASCRDREWTPTKAEAFRWLGALPAPMVIGPEAEPAPTYTMHVPNNDGDRQPDRQKRLTAKGVRPRRIVGGPTLHYVWPIEDGDAEHADALRPEARHLLALGWGIDQVVGNGRVVTQLEADRLPGQRWRPWSGLRPGSETWRVPRSGSLEALEHVHESCRDRIRGNVYHPPSRFRHYDEVVYVRADRLPPRAYAAFELPDGVAFRQEATAAVAAMARSLACRMARADTHVLPGGSEVYVAGHAGDARSSPERFSYLPLPTIGHPNADGLVRRVLVAEPLGGDGTHARWATDWLASAPLRDESGNERGMMGAPWRPSSKEMIGRYVAESREWASVTPVVVPGHDDGKRSKAEGLLGAALEHAGIPESAVTDIVLRKAPFWPGAEHPRCYFLPDYLRGNGTWHVYLAFREPVPGPIAVGAGRHSGLGLLAGLKG